ncbi:MAG: zinc-ribbon domain-containing protein [Prevotellaceae bacterium]|jgi:uncharacterized membrane protein YvbJ|nr:zinc-ribbon domain-containing protein [Prevotellaceae bacterium]
MFCTNCGKQIEDGSKFCSHCGTTLTEQTNVAQPANAETNTQNQENFQTEAKTEKNMSLIVLAYICWGFAVIDFCGMFFEYDLTGVSWSPLVAGGIGYLFSYLGNNE